jgi:putrescine transport system ATP-binding protein
MRLSRDAPGAADENCLAGTLAEIGYLGDLSVYRIRLADGSLVKAAVANSGGAPAPRQDELVYLHFSPDAAIVLTR